MNDKLIGIENWNRVMTGISQESLQIAPYFTHQIKHNIRHVLFTFARYKFAARLLGDFPKRSVLELGCNEGIGTLHLAQVASETLAVDFDERAIEWASKNLSSPNLSYVCDDFMEKKYGEFDAVVSLDVLEHIENEKEEQFLSTIISNLNSEGFAIIGTPNLTASPYASEASRIGHINLYDGQRLKELLLKGFKNVFLFGMNDEVVHTGYIAMCHYLFVLACNKRE